MRNIAEFSPLVESYFIFSFSAASKKPSTTRPVVKQVKFISNKFYLPSQTRFAFSSFQSAPASPLPLPTFPAADQGHSQGSRGRGRRRQVIWKKNIFLIFCGNLWCTFKFLFSGLRRPPPPPHSLRGGGGGPVGNINNRRPKRQRNNRKKPQRPRKKVNN